MIFTTEQYAAFHNVSIPNALRQLASIKQTFLAGHVGKQTRPWFVVDFPALHPAEATLVGFEIETGFASAEARSSFLNWMWDNTDYTTVDREGCSSCPTEITFPPMPLARLLSDESPILGMFQYNETLDDPNRLRTTRVTASESRGGTVGTHTNISTAAFRAASNEVRGAVTTALARFFQALDGSQKYALLGRQPYTSGVAQVRGGAGDGALRIEFKMFHTTTDVEQFRNYLKVSQRLAELIDDLCAGGGRRSLHGTHSAINNTFAFLTQDLAEGMVIRRGNPQYTTVVVEAAASANRGTPALAA